MAECTMGSDQLKLIQDLLESYDSKAKPTWDNNRPVNVTFSMDLYQLLELVSFFLSLIVIDLFFKNTNFMHPHKKTLVHKLFQNISLIYATKVLCTFEMSSLKCFRLI
jgi:hypothetical protein